MTRMDWILVLAMNTNLGKFQLICGTINRIFKNVVPREKIEVLQSYDGPVLSMGVNCERQLRNKKKNTNLRNSIPKDK